MTDYEDFGPDADDFAPLATEAEADAEWARNVGAAQPDREWILSDRDVWYRNAAYTGKPGRHPEDDYGDEDEERALRYAESGDAGRNNEVEFDDIPF